MIDQKVSTTTGGVRPLRLRHQEALIRQEMRRLVPRSSGTHHDAGDCSLGTLRRLTRSTAGPGSTSGLDFSRRRS
jgi:hypothetical protein